MKSGDDDHAVLFRRVLVVDVVHIIAVVVAVGDELVRTDEESR